MRGGDNMGKQMTVKSARIKKKLTQQELAERVGVNRQTISMIEMGVNKPSVELAKKIGQVLKVKWYLFFED